MRTCPQCGEERSENAFLINGEFESTLCSWCRGFNRGQRKARVVRGEQ